MKVSNSKLKLSPLKTFQWMQAQLKPRQLQRILPQPLKMISLHTISKTMKSLVVLKSLQLELKALTAILTMVVAVILVIDQVMHIIVAVQTVGKWVKINLTAVQCPNTCKQLAFQMQWKSQCINVSWKDHMISNQHPCLTAIAHLSKMMID